MRSFERVWVFGLVAVSVNRIGVSAVTTSTVTCTTDLWSINHEGQTPCQVAAALEGACFNNMWNIGPLPVGQKYSGPVSGQSNKCQCNTVAFALVAACGDCQGAGVSTWQDWIANCSAPDITIGGFPLTIPPGTNVPAWAYIDPTITGGVWDASAAQTSANGRDPEITGGSPPSLTHSPTGSSNSATSSPTPSTSASSSSSHAGAIAGGVVGGVVGVALIGFIAFFLYRRKRRSNATPGLTNDKVDLVGAASPAPAYVDGFQSPHLPMQQEPPRLYDPSDPSTFPTTPLPSQYAQGPPGYASPAPSTAQYTAKSSHIPTTPGGYSGAPEV